MEIAQEKRGAVHVLGPVGRLDTDSAADLELALQDLLAAKAAHYVVDLSQINYVSSAGLRVLLMLAKSVDGNKGSLRLSGLNPQVQQVFDIAGFTKLFKIHPDRDAALRDHPAIGIEDVAPAPAAAPPPREPKADAPREPKAEAPREPRAEAPREPKAEAPREPKAEAPREPKAEAPRETAPPVAARPPAPSVPHEPPPAARAAEPSRAPAASVAPEAPVERPRAAAPDPAPAPQRAATPAPAPALADHVARLLGVGPAANTPFDPSTKSLGRHAAMLLGVELDGAPAAPPKKEPGPKSARPAAKAPAEDPDEKGGLLSRLFGKKKRSNL